LIDTRRDATALLQRGQLAVLVTLILLTVGASGLTIIQAQSMPGRMGGVVEPAAIDDPPAAMGDMTTTGEMGAMPGSGGTANPGTADMAGPGWQLGGLAAFVVAWSIMMAAMMLPVGRRIAYAIGVAFLVFGGVVASGRVAMPGIV